MSNLEYTFPPYKHAPNPELIHINLRNLMVHPLSEVSVPEWLTLQEENKAVGEIHFLFSRAKVCVNQCGDRLILAEDVHNIFSTRYAFEDYRKLLPLELQKELTLTVKIKDGYHGEYYPAELLTEICFQLAYGENPLLKQKETQPLVALAEALLGSLCLVGIIPLIDEATGYQSERQASELICLFNQSYLKGNKKC